VSESAPPAGTLRHHVWLYAPPDERPRLAALFDIEHQMMASARPGMDHAVAHARLAWWQEECERLAAGQPRHPRTAALLRATRQAAGAAPDLSPLVDAVRWDLANAVPENRGEVERRCDNWARGLFRHLAPGPANSGVSRAGISAWLEGAGRAVEELSMLTQVRRDAARGRLRLPLDELAAQGVEPGGLSAADYPPQLVAHLASRHRALRADLVRRLLDLDRAARPGLRTALVWIALAASDSRRAERSLAVPGAGSRLAPLADTWTAWRAARSALASRIPSVN
jgi:phytoene synthase